MYTAKVDTGSIMAENLPPVSMRGSEKAEETLEIKELLAQIFTQLELPALCSTACVCKSWSSLASSDYLWQTIAKNRGLSALLFLWPKEMPIKRPAKEYLQRCNQLFNAINGRYGIDLDAIGTDDWLKDYTQTSLKAKEYWDLDTMLWASGFDSSWVSKRNIWAAKNRKVPLVFSYREGFEYLLLKIEIARSRGIERVDLLGVNDPFCGALSNIVHTGERPEECKYFYWLFVISVVLKEEGHIKELVEHGVSTWITIDCGRGQ